MAPVADAAYLSVAFGLFLAAVVRRSSPLWGLALLWAVVPAIWLVARDVGGADYRVYCAAVAVRSAGGNPYSVDQLAGLTGAGFSFNYPSLTLLLFEPLCVLDGRGRIITLVFGAVTAAAVAHLCTRNAALAAIYALAAFQAFRWSVSTGNFAQIQIGMFAVALALARRGKTTSGALVAGAVGSVKLISLSIVVPIIVFARDMRARALACGAAGVALLVVCAGSWLSAPDLFAHYIAQIAGTTEAHQASREWSLLSNNVALPIACLDLFAAFTSVGWAGLVVYAVIIGAVIVRVARRWAGYTRIEQAACLTLVLLMLWPRLKPYDFGFAGVAIALMLPSEASALARLMAVTVVIPLVVHVAPWLFPGEAWSLVGRAHQPLVLLAGAWIVTGRLARPGEFAPKVGVRDRGHSTAI